MTDPEAAGQSLPTAAVPVAPGPPGSAHDAVTGHDPAIAQAAAAASPRRRRRWPLVTLVSVIVVAALAGGLVVWAPWTQPPVLRPAGLVAGPATANSVSFRWARPATGPLPDKYLILSNDGTVAGSVAGTVTSYRQAGLTPASNYQYQVVAVRGGKRSPRSAPLAVSTRTPTMSQARLQGLWDVYVKYIRRSPGSRNGTLLWDFIPACAAVTCNVLLHVIDGKHSFKLTMARAGAVYQGHVMVGFIRCGRGPNSIPDPTTLRFRVHATDAMGQGQAWVATRLAGTMVGISKYVSSATFYCPASRITAALRGTPH